MTSRNPALNADLEEARASLSQLGFSSDSGFGTPA